MFYYLQENLWLGAIFEGILAVNVLKKFWSMANPISFELSYAEGLKPQQIVSLQESISFNDKGTQLYMIMLHSGTFLIRTLTGVPKVALVYKHISEMRTPL